jgi:hypothetical protein
LLPIATTISTRKKAQAKPAKNMSKRFPESCSTMKNPSASSDVLDLVAYRCLVTDDSTGAVGQSLFWLRPGTGLVASNTRDVGADREHRNIKPDAHANASPMADNEEFERARLSAARWASDVS